MDQRWIEDLIIELMAAQSHREPAALRAHLEELGGELPVDSLLAAEVLAEMEARLGVTLPATAETSRNLRSVSRFAEALLELATESDRARAGREA
jgi:acyl carrier protein